jgi:hypothetical protein
MAEKEWVGWCCEDGTHFFCFLLFFCFGEGSGMDIAGEM